jgi:transcriptional regulator with XRE-family HTH domain
MAKTFGQRLQALREAKGLSQGELARRAGFSKQTASSLEKDTYEPLWKTVQAVVQALGCGYEDLADQPAKRRGRPAAKK